jgi:hypothetical protein
MAVILLALRRDLKIDTVSKRGVEAAARRLEFPEIAVIVLARFEAQSVRSARAGVEASDGMPDRKPPVSVISAPQRRRLTAMPLADLALT